IPPWTSPVDSGRLKFIHMIAKRQPLSPNLDDVNIYSSSFEKHLSHVDVILVPGHKISGKGITPTVTKVAPIKENFAWKKEQQEAFDELKSRLTSAPILTHLQDDVGFVLYTNASHLALGAVLSQFGDNGLEGVVEYVS
ncbi:15254_t:CDS:2, partial [Cetraspora pellucida]